MLTIAYKLLTLKEAIILLKNNKGYLDADKQELVIY